MKQFHMHARYWSRAEDRVVRKYVASSFLGHARAGDLKTSIMEALSKDGLPLVNITCMFVMMPDTYVVIGPYVQH